MSSCETICHFTCLSRYEDWLAVAVEKPFENTEWTTQVKVYNQSELNSLREKYIYTQVRLCSLPVRIIDAVQKELIRARNKKVETAHLRFTTPRNFHHPCVRLTLDKFPLPILN